METSPGNITKEEGLRLMKAGQFSEAIEILEQLVEQEPESAELQGYTGIAYFQKGDKLHAIRHLEESINIQETPRMYYNLGLVYEAAYREDEAIRQYKMALALDPNYAPAQKAMEKLQQTFEAAHPAPQPEEQTVEMQAAQEGAEPTIGAAPKVVPPIQPQRPTGPPDPLLLQIEKQKKMMEHQKALLKSGLAYGVVCGAIMIPAVFFCMGRFAGASVPKFATEGYGLFVFTFILMIIGGLYGAGVGFWVAKTCEGEGAGMKAGAVIGAVIGMILGLFTGNAFLVVMNIITMGVAGGLAGMLIGRLVDSSIGWD